jgi:hypothetical protein
MAEPPALELGFQGNLIDARSGLTCNAAIMTRGPLLSMTDRRRSEARRANDGPQYSTVLTAHQTRCRDETVDGKLC